MEQIYIPKGKTLRYASLACRDIVNDGALVVENGIQARHIYGRGVVNAGSISCRSLAASDINAACITTGRLAAERVCASEVRVSGAAAVSCCLEAAYVETPRLTVALSQIGELRAREVVNLSDKQRSIPGALLAGFFRRLWMSLAHRVPRDAGYGPVQPEEREPVPETAEDGGPPVAELWEDFEFRRLAGLYRLLKPEGYTLRLVPLPSAEERPDLSRENAA